MFGQRRLKQASHHPKQVRVYVPLVGLFLISLFVAASVAAQQRDTKENALAIEIGKTGLIYNLAFDHRFGMKKFGLRLSAGSNFYRYKRAATAGGGVYGLLGGRRHFLELGADLLYLHVEEVSDDQRGLTLFYPDFPISTYYASLNIGYRVYGEKTLFRIGVAPGVFKEGFIAGGYIGFGLRL